MVEPPPDWEIEMKTNERSRRGREKRQSETVKQCTSNCSAADIPRIIRWFCLCKVIVLSLAVIGDFWVADYDTSTELLEETSLSPLDSVLLRLGRGFSHWDAVYFTEISLRGYSYENYHAFFPLFPLLIRYIRYSLFFLASLSPIRIDAIVLSDRNATLFIGLLINNIASLFGAIQLFKLSIAVFSRYSLHSERLALLSALLYCIAPSTIFLTGLYSEALYALFTFWGIRYIYQTYNSVSSFPSVGKEEVKGLLAASLVLSCTSGIRSTGFLYGLFFAFYFFNRIFHRSSGGLQSIVEYLKLSIVMIICCLILALPLWSYQYFSYTKYCMPNELNPPEVTPWCNKMYPDVYNYVQERYWNVGLFRYYQLSQIPNFLLAAPILLITFYGLFFYGRYYLLPLVDIYSITHYILSGLWYSKKKENGNDKGYWSVLLCWDTLPFFAHWFFLLGVSLTVLHVQVSTRFMSATPPVYWVASAILLEEERVRKGRLIGNSILGYFITYVVLGCLLHCNFYPWT